MSGRLAVVMTVTYVLGVCPVGIALEFGDDFSRPHDYLAHGPSSTGWDGVEGLAGPATEALDSSWTRPGQLYLQSAGADWHSDLSVPGPFLYKSVTGDFVVTVRLVDFAGTADIAVPHNRAGLMVRMGATYLAGPGEDWLALDYYPYWGQGNCVRQADDNRISTQGTNNQNLAPDPFLQIERRGDAFTCRSSPDGRQWRSLPGSPVTRPDLHALALQVGVYQVTESDHSGYAAFDDFRIDTATTGADLGPGQASGPNPPSGAIGVSQSILSWQPGPNITGQSLYVGPTPDDLTLLGDSLEPDRGWWALPGTVSAGADYYWRVDSVDQTGNQQTGDLWTFTTAPYRAYSPQPASDASDLPDRHLALTWHPGQTAIWHEVYFSESRQRVATGHASAYRGRQVNVSFDPGPLKNQVTYYWRIDEVELDGQTRHGGDVWSFTTMAEIAVEDPDLVGWWTFDTGTAGYVVDVSGHGNHGRMLGAPQPCPGQQGLGLAFDGIQDCVRCAQADIPTGSRAFTIAAWILPSTHNNTLVQWGLARANQGNELRLLGGHYCRHSFWNNNVDFDTGDLTGEWNHLALAWDGDQRMCYVNGGAVAGQHLGQFDGPPSVSSTEVSLGAHAQMSAQYYSGAMDDVRIYRIGLDAADIRALMQNESDAAFAPQPEHQSQVPFVTRLVWSAARNAVKHDLYLGLDQATVRHARTSDGTDIYQGRLPQPHFALSRGLDAGQTYYWRVDEVSTDGAVVQGRVWRFDVLPSQVLDDFEGYLNYPPLRVFETWLDGLGYQDPSPGFAGNGSGSVVGYDTAPYAETVIVQNGQQSLPLRFDNRQKPYYSQADRAYAQPQDWAGPGFTGLTLAFCGLSSNQPNARDHLYVAVADQSGTTVRVYYQDAAAHYADGDWHKWRIPFGSLSGLDWRGITALHIGVGNPDQPRPGSHGLLFIDDIYLTQSR